MQNDFFKDYMAFASETTDCPETFHWFVSYGIASAIIGRNCYFPFGDNNIYSNLWLILLAPSSEFRKSTALGIGLGILRKVNPTLVLASRFTEEALMADLTQNPQGLIPFFEFKTLLDLVKKDYNAGLKSFLTELYDVPEILSRKTKSGENKTERPFISIISATTSEWFLSSCKEDDFASGFLARFLFIPVVSKGKDLPIPPPADQTKKEALVNSLKKTQGIKGTMSLSSAAREAHNEWYLKFKHREKIPQFRGIYSRLQIYLLKLSMIHSIMVFQSLVINESSVKEAINLTNWLLTQFEGFAKTELAFNKFERNRKKILSLITEGKNHRGELLQYSNLSARDFDEVIRTVIETGQVSQERGQKGGTVYAITKTELTNGLSASKC
jgi:predicted transcriptional regulator